PGHRAHVGGRSDGLPACGVDLVDYVLGEAEVLPGTGEFGADIVDDDAGSLPCRQQGVGATESPARTGDDHYAVLECIHDHSFVCSSAGRTRVYAAPNPLRVSVASATTLSMSSLTVGTSSIIPTTWPEAMMPTSALPSSRAVRSSIGALAVMMTRLQGIPWAFFIASPSLMISDHGVPDIFWNAMALRPARASLRTGPVPSSAAIVWPLMTRWGSPSISFVSTVPLRSVPR